MPEDDRKDATRDAVAREIEAAVNEQVSGLPRSRPTRCARRSACACGKRSSGIFGPGPPRSGAKRHVSRRRRGRRRSSRRKGRRSPVQPELRFQHMVMFSSVILLIITGMPLKFPNFLLSRFVINFWEGSRTPPSSTASARGC